MAAEPASGDAVPGAVPSEEFAWALGAMCTLHRVPFDADLLLKQFPPPYSIDKLIAALQALGLRAGQSSAASLGSMTAFPCVGFTGGEGPDAAARQLHVAILAGREGDNVVLFDAASPQPRAVPLASVLETFEPLVLLVTRDASPAADPDSARAKPERFGFRWFVPELLRHRRIWRDVLAASLALQVAGLARLCFLSWHAE